MLVEMYCEVEDPKKPRCGVPILNAAGKCHFAWSEEGPTVLWRPAQ